MTDSILTSVKAALGITEDYLVFDQDLILFINGTFSTLNQLGIGPESGFTIEDSSAEWVDFLGGEVRYDFVKTYVYLKVRLLFDPPTVGFVISAFEKQLDELTWRINVMREEIVYPSSLTRPGINLTAERKDITVQYGDSWSLDLSWTDEDKQPISLVGATIIARLRASEESAIVLSDFDINVTNAANGEFTISQTQALYSGFYEVKINLSSEIHTLVNGGFVTTVKVG